MATVGNGNLTLIDMAKRTDPSGAVSQIMEQLAQTNPIVEDAVVKEGNLPTGTRITRRSSLPTVATRRFNQGTAPSKSTTEQTDEVTTMIDGFSIVDCALAKLNGDEAAYRQSEDGAWLEAFSQKLNTLAVYSDLSLAPDAIQGWTPRYNATAGNPYANQIIKADSTASGNDQTSIWLVGWGDKQVHLVTPKGQGTGLVREDLGKLPAYDANNNPFTAWQTHFTWNFGMAVEDYGYLVRACNIDTGNWKPDLSAGADIPMVLEQMITRYKNPAMGKPVFYMARDSFTMLQMQLAKKYSQNAIQYLPGERFARFRGMPIKFADCLTKTESVVS
jgi:hypothetical protein